MFKQVVPSTQNRIENGKREKTFDNIRSNALGEQNIKL